MVQKLRRSPADMFGKSHSYWKTMHFLYIPSCAGRISEPSTVERKEVIWSSPEGIFPSFPAPSLKNYSFPTCCIHKRTPNAKPLTMKWVTQITKLLSRLTQVVTPSDTDRLCSIEKATNMRWMRGLKQGHAWFFACGSPFPREWANDCFFTTCFLGWIMVGFSRATPNHIQSTNQIGPLGGSTPRIGSDFQPWVMWVGLSLVFLHPGRLTWNLQITHEKKGKSSEPNPYDLYVPAGLSSRVPESRPAKNFDQVSVPSTLWRQGWKDQSCFATKSKYHPGAHATCTLGVPGWISLEISFLRVRGC